MPNNEKSIKDEDLIFHILNVGRGDTIIVEFPVDKNGNRSYGLVDCYNSKKTREYFAKLRTLRPGKSNFKFICATHPHLDHVAGINYFIKTKKYQPALFWDSGFRHQIVNYLRILESINENEEIRMVRVSSGMEWYYGHVQVTALAPSIALRNRYATYGVDVNNASIVLRFENHKGDVLLMKSKEYSGTVSREITRDIPPSVVILAGDAEFDSWSHIVHEFPRLETTSDHKPLVRKIVNYLNCSAIKVAHHGSMHSAPLDIYEIMNPEKAIISAKQEVSKLEIGERTLSRELFPHASTIIALEECGAVIATTEGSYEKKIDENGNLNSPEWKDQGSIIVVVPPGGATRWKKLDDTSDPEDIPNPPQDV